MLGHIQPVCTGQPAVPFGHQWPRVPTKQIMDQAIAILASQDSRNITLPQARSNFYDNMQYAAPAQNVLSNYFIPQEPNLTHMYAPVMAYPSQNVSSQTVAGQMLPQQGYEQQALINPLGFDAYTVREQTICCICCRRFRMRQSEV